MTTLLIGKPELESELVDELTLRTGLDPATIEHCAAGVLAIAREPPTPLVFERQRIEAARHLPGSTLRALVRDTVKQLLPPITVAETLWTTHVFTVDSQIGEAGRARLFQEFLLDFIRERFPRVYRRYRPAAAIAESAIDFTVLNLLILADGIRGAAMPAARLSDTHPGGVHRKAFDPAAPSRSYLKLEEAFDTLGCAPLRGASVVDLGAAPGGWSYACLKRGCGVTAVDNGPLRIHEPDRFGGKLTHLRADGLTFRPAPRDVPVDWLVSDMLVTAGKDIGMLRPWFTGRWMRRFVVNIKLPQTHAYRAIIPVEDYLATVPDIRFAIRHLYHDRREVTLMGSVGQ